jgi:hypothetical protein
MLHKGYGCKGSVAKKKKSLVVNLKAFGTKTNWLAVNRQSSSKSDSDIWHMTYELSQLRVAAVRSEKLVAEAGDGSGT